MQQNGKIKSHFSVKDKILSDDDRVDQPQARMPVDGIAQRVASVEKLRPQDARLEADIQDLPFQPQLGREVGRPIADNGPPRIRQFAFGDLRRDVGAFEKRFEQVAHQQGFRPSHGVGSFGCSTVIRPSVTRKSV